MRLRNVYWALPLALLIAATIYVSGSNSAVRHKVAKPTPSVTKPALPNSDLLKVALEDVWVKRLALSSDGSKLAAILQSFDPACYPYVKVWDTASGKELYTLDNRQTKHIIAEIDWHPQKHLLAVSGGYNAPIIAGGSVGKISSGLVLISLQDEKKREITWLGDPGEPFAWMPDGKNILVRDRELPLSIVDSKSGEFSIFGPDIGRRSYATRIATSADGVIAIEDGYLESKDHSFSRIQLFDPIRGQNSKYSQVGELEAVKDDKGRPILPTLPAFIRDRRLVYLRWHSLWRMSDEQERSYQLPDPKRLMETAEAELWVADERGRNAKRWVVLPEAHIRHTRYQVTERLYSISGDAKTLAFVRDNVIHVKNVSPPN